LFSSNTSHVLSVSRVALCGFPRTVRMSKTVIGSPVSGFM
jgi:hypothetical protein